MWITCVPGAQDKEPISWLRLCRVVGVERLYARGSTSAQTSLPAPRADHHRLGSLSHDPAQPRLRLFRKELCSSGSMHIVSWYAPNSQFLDVNWEGMTGPRRTLGPRG